MQQACELSEGRIAGRWGSVGKVLIWYAQWGDQLQSLKAMEAKGMNIQALKDRPDIPESIAAAFMCYLDLAAGGGAHTWRAVKDWACTYGCDAEQEEEIWE